MVSSYSLSHYGDMILDEGRVQPFLQALERHAPGAVVLEIGTGPGFFALAACKFGAAKVYALDPSPYIEVGRRGAKANGLADRIEFIEEISTRIELQDRVDVLLSDMRGILPFLAEHIPSVIDARQRLVKPQGVMIAQMDTLWAMPVECPGQWGRHQQPWAKGYEPLSLDLSAGLSFTLNTTERFACRDREHLLERPAKLGQVDYRTVGSPDFSGQASWTSIREATVHGFVVWFDCQVDEGLGFSNSPLAEKIPNSYGQLFLPLKDPLQVQESQEIALSFSARLTESNYLYQWSGTVGGQRFGQSSLFAQPDLRQRLQRQRQDFAPGLGVGGRLTLKVLSLMGEGKTLEEIAEALRGQFGFGDLDGAMRVVQELAAHYGA